MKDQIDFVVLWVNGNDRKWIKDKEKYSININNYDKTSNNVSRFRDWGNMKYWFRGVEKFAPWVRKIHFVTYGHIPSFLNTSAPKLHIVNHKDFIEEKYLPLFNSCAIEINLNKIPGISEKFIYFNDDMFLINNVDPKDFFYNNLPCYEGLQGTVTSVGDGSSYCHQMLNDLDIINRNFNKRKQMKNHFFKWYSAKYGFEIFRNLLLIPWKKYVGFKNSHLPTPYLKSTFDEVWYKENHTLSATCSHRFRTYYDVNQYVFRYWQLASGKFYPRIYNGKKFEIYDYNIDEIQSTIRNQKYKMVCLNDPDQEINFELLKRKINNSFKYILSSKSKFEK